MPCSSDRATLESLRRRPTTPQWLIQRAQITLALLNKEGVRATARKYLVRPCTVRKWWRRYQEGLGLEDAKWRDTDATERCAALPVRLSGRER